MKIDLKLNKLYLHTKGELYNCGILFKSEKKGMNAYPIPLFFVIYTYIHKCYRTLMGIFFYAQSNICSISTISLTLNMYVHSLDTPERVMHAGARKSF